MPRTSSHTLTLPSDLEIQMTRVFDAPRELVFKAITDPAAIPQWWGPRYLTTVVDRMDVRVGGAWRYVQTAPDGTVHAFNGVYKEIVPPERIAYTFEYEPMPGHICVDTATLEDLGGKTRVTVTTRFDSVEDRDGMLNSGMEGGASESWDRLAELLEKLA
jgi:uncharacterized protein YndB with AHSA1/START domain